MESKSNTDYQIIGSSLNWRQLLQCSHYLLYTTPVTMLVHLRTVSLDRCSIVLQQDIVIHCLNPVLVFLISFYNHRWKERLVSYFLYLSLLFKTGDLPVQWYGRKRFIVLRKRSYHISSSINSYKIPPEERPPLGGSSASVTVTSRLSLTSRESTKVRLTWITAD